MAIWFWTVSWVILLSFLLITWKLFLLHKWHRPRVLETKLRQQGINGPPRSLLGGNVNEMMKMKAEAEARIIPDISHNIVEYVQPEVLVQWSKAYGIPFCMWWGSDPAVVLTDLEMIKEVMYNKSGVFWKPAWQMKLQADILGRGLAVVVGEEWAFRRRMMTPAFHQEKIKGMVGSMVSSVSLMLENWNSLIHNKDDPVEVEVGSHFLELTADIISRTAFGSSYKLGRTVFELLGELGNLVFQKFTRPWIYNLLPASKLNRKIKQLHHQLDSTLDEIIKPRLDKAGNGNNFGSDLLGLMLQEVDINRLDSDLRNRKLSFTIESLKEECKTFYVGGHETSSRLLTWTMMLLAINESWQDLARAEAVQVCKSSGGLPDAESLGKLKVIGMVLNESLRLYPPAVLLLRSAYEETEVGGLRIPAGVGVVIPVLRILHSEEVWGSDVNEFNPQRFADGVANAAQHSFAFLPFGQGQRVCIGQSFALTEAKIALAMMLQRFSFKMSPGYRHSPVSRLALMPQHGMPLLVQKI